MKVAINTRPVDGPWGGGNRFVHSLAGDLERGGHKVAYELTPDTDVALIIDPRQRNPHLTFSAGDIWNHLRRHPKMVVVHRINECDERKDTKSMNARLRWANYVADHTLFIAGWLSDLTVWRKESDWSVIRNGADTELFQRDSAKVWNGDGPLRFVTHHWGAHKNKGWDVYSEFGNLIAKPRWKDKVSLTFIGNVPSDFNVDNIEVKAPLDGAKLVDELSEHHAYVTASINEPAGMHHVEGAMLGMPLLFRRSGALPEYCEGFGVGFDGTMDFEASLQRFVDEYADHRLHMSQYANTSERMSQEYIALFKRLVERRDELASKRNLWRDPMTILANQLPI